MSESTHLVGIVEDTETFENMLAVQKACRAAGVGVPPEVDAYFDDVEYDEDGIQMDLSDRIREWGDDSRAGVEIDVADIPKDVKTLRFYISY